MNDEVTCMQMFSSVLHVGSCDVNKFMGLVKVLCELGWGFLWSWKAGGFLGYLFLLIVAQQLGGGWVGSCLTKYTGLQKQYQGHRISGQKENPDQLSHFTEKEMGPGR